jgi:hypothetical protein
MRGMFCSGVRLAARFACHCADESAAMHENALHTLKLLQALDRAGDKG